MMLHLIPVVLAIAIPVGTYVEVVQRNAPVVADLQARVLRAATQYDTVNASTVIKPRLASERAAIAKRLQGVRPFGISEAQSTFLSELVRAARINHVSLVSVATKGKPVPFAAASAPPTPTPQIAPGAPPTAVTTAAPAGRQPALALSSLADGMTIPQEIVVKGSLQHLLGFVDAFGHFAVPVQVGNVAFGTNEALSLTVDCDIVVISATELADAKRPTLTDIPAMPPAPFGSPLAATSVMPERHQ